MVYLQGVSLEAVVSTDRFPFNIPAFQNLAKLKLNSPGTFFVGENGSGKSTLLEAIACAAGLVFIGSEPSESDESLSSIRPLADSIKLVWHHRARRGFFSRAEDYFGYTKHLARLRRNLQEDLRTAERELEKRSRAAQLYGTASYRKELDALEHRYNGDLIARSHGESFLDFLQARFLPGGLYLLDEPESALSPTRQLTLLGMLKAMVEEHDCQFIIATHSPMLLAVPGATILSLDHDPIRDISYEDVQHVKLMKSFLNEPLRYLRHF